MTLITAPSVLPLPLDGARIAAGFPAPADDDLEGTLDLNTHLVAQPAATFCVRVQGESMTGVGIHKGDLMVPRNGRFARAMGTAWCASIRAMHDSQRAAIRSGDHDFFVLDGTLQYFDDVPVRAVEGQTQPRAVSRPTFSLITDLSSWTQ